MHITNLNSLFEEFKDTAAPSARDKVKSLSNLLVSLKDRSLSPDDTTTTISSIKSLLDDINTFSQKRENHFSGSKILGPRHQSSSPQFGSFVKPSQQHRSSAFLARRPENSKSPVHSPQRSSYLLSTPTSIEYENLDILSCIPETATAEDATLVLQTIRNALTKKLKILREPPVKPNYQKIFEKSHGDILSIFTQCEANVFAQKIFAGHDIGSEVDEFYEKVDMTSESFSKMPSKLSLTNFAIRKSSTRMRIIGAMAVMTHFLQTHEIENDEMLHRMEEYEKLAYNGLINDASQIPALIEDITCFGALQSNEELVIAANELKQICVKLAKSLPQVFKKASEVVGGNVAERYKSAENDISETINGCINFIKEVDVYDNTSKGGIMSVEESKKALQGAGSSLLAVVWHIIHLKPKDERNMIFRASQNIELCIELFFRNEHQLYIEMVAVIHTIIMNLRKYISAVYSLQNVQEKVCCEDSTLVSQKVINSKGKVIAGGVVGLLIESRTNAQLGDVVYSMLPQFGHRIYDILENLPAGNQELVAQKVIQKIFAKCDTNQLKKFVSEDKSPLFIKLQSVYDVMEHSLMKTTTEVLSPICDFLIPSQELSPFMTLAVTDPLTIANQLTAISFKMYKKITVDDFFEKSGQVELLSQRVEDLSSWVCTATLSFTDFNSRAFMKNLFSLVLKNLLAIGDFNSAYGVFLGIGKIGLDFNKCLVPEKQTQIVAHAEKLFGNLKTLKAAYKKFKVCIPYIGTVLECISAVKGGKYQFYACGEERLVDYGIQKEIYVLSSEYLKYQEEDYNIAAVEPLNAYLTTLARFDKRCLDLLRQYHE